MIQQINQLISGLYSDNNYTELKALSLLISKRFISGLENILNSKAINIASYNEEYKVSLGWIDKCPYAQFINKTKDHWEIDITNKRVEIGDLLIIFSSNEITHKRVQMRASIIQTKISKKIPLFEVPIDTLSENNCTSTSKQLALLSSWPEFDLYKAARSNSTLLSHLKVLSSNQNSKFSGYHNKAWYCGDPQFGDQCSISLGDHFYNILHNIDGTVFDPSSPKSDWDKLITTMMDLCETYTLPPSQYGITDSKKMVHNFLLFNNISRTAKYRNRFTITNWRCTKRYPIIMIDKVMKEGEF
jgi:hypothetical protein